MAFKIVLLSGAALLAAGPALAAADKPAKPVDPDKKICHRQEVTGSLLAESVCHTKAEWDAIYKQEHDTSQRQYSSPSTGSQQPG